jgi:RNA polymerase sigma-70 factor, ECF subfamily
MEISLDTAAGLVAAPQSFAAAYREYVQRVARWAVCLGGGDCDVEEVVQEVFLVVSRKLGTFRGESTFATWLFQITRRIAANQRRRSRWRQLWAGGDAELEQMAWPGLDPSAELERRYIAAAFQRALDRLPEKYRTVLVLYELDGLSTQAIAELCQRNQSTIKVQLARARERFLAAYHRLIGQHAQWGESGLAELADKVLCTDPDPADRAPTLRTGRKRP